MIVELFAMRVYFCSEAIYPEMLFDRPTLNTTAIVRAVLNCFSGTHRETVQKHFVRLKNNTFVFP